MPDVIEVVTNLPTVAEVRSQSARVTEVIMPGPAGVEGPPGPPGGVSAAEVEALIEEETEGGLPSPALVFANALI